MLALSDFVGSLFCVVGVPFCTVLVPLSVGGVLVCAVFVPLCVVGVPPCGVGLLLEPGRTATTVLDEDDDVALCGIV